jgi:hypothetical protein
MRAHHDVGGLPAEPVDRSEHEPALWEKRVHALLNLLSERGVMTVDELRQGIEALGAEKYDRLGYYERWIESIAGALQHRGLLTTEELARKFAEVEARAGAQP